MQRIVKINILFKFYVAKQYVTGFKRTFEFHLISLKVIIFFGLCVENFCFSNNIYNVYLHGI